MSGWWWVGQELVLQLACQHGTPRLALLPRHAAGRLWHAHMSINCCLVYPVQVKVYLADFSQATDIINLYPVTNGTANYVYFDSTTFSELSTALPCL